MDICGKLLKSLRSFKELLIYETTYIPLCSILGLASDKSERIMTREGKIRETYKIKVIEDSSISQAMLKMAQECVEATEKEVVGLREKLTKTSQEAKEKLQ